MATTKTKTTETEEVVENVEKTVTKTVKKFKNTDEIECVSITPGQLFVEGTRSGDLYIFADADDVQYIRYDDLLYMVRRTVPSVFRPRFIIHDEDFLEQNPVVKKLYGALYSTKDLKAILRLDTYEMLSKLATLPVGIHDSFKTLVATEISSGRLDSIKKIRAIDEFFGTNLLNTVTDM